MTVATDDNYKDRDGNWQKKTEWVSVVAFNKTYITGKYHKGDMVLVEGKLQTRSYEKNGEKRYVTEVNAMNIKNLSTYCNRGGASSAHEDSGDVPY